MDRGDQRKAFFKDDEDLQKLLSELGKLAARPGSLRLALPAPDSDL
jgi:hypothetical protein